MQRQKRPVRLTALERAKRKEQLELALIYAPEREKIYSGEEEFMNTLHPFEETGKNSGKKSSPIQKAIIYSIKENGGKATEDQLFQFIKKKWPIIIKYTERGFIMEPSIRVIRLNCAVKKRGRHLFLKVPKLKDTWMLNSAPRKLPQRKGNLKVKAVSSESEENPEQNIQIEQEEEEQNELIVDTIMTPDTFEHIIEEIFTENEVEYTLEELCLIMEKHKKKKGLYMGLPFDRRVRATLIVLKYQNVIVYDENTQKYRSVSKITKVQDKIPDIISNPPRPVQDMTLDEFYNNVLEKFKH